ncbi:MAG: arginine repressor [Oscillospiraceae bacterium]
MKLQRQSKILQLIEQYDIETQMELTEQLNQCGFETTQATVSRDIKELRLIKATTKSGKNKYAAANGQAETGFSSRLRTIFREGVLSYDYAQNIVVIKTMPGLASAACSTLDGMHVADVVGTIAGDDTGFLVLRSADSACEFCRELKKMLE